MGSDKDSNIEVNEEEGAYYEAVHSRQRSGAPTPPNCRNKGVHIRTSAGGTPVVMFFLLHATSNHGYFP
jgi:hypothetical protein